MFENAVKVLITAAREYNVEVIYVRHYDCAGAELTKGTPGFELYEGFNFRDIIYTADRDSGKVHFNEGFFYTGTDKIL